MRKEIPAGVLEMLTIPGLRPDKVAQIYMELGIASIEELEGAATKDRLKGIKGRRCSEKSYRVSSYAGAITDVGICIGRPPSSRPRKKICAPQSADLR
jgi:hypothetical protein